MNSTVFQLAAEFGAGPISLDKIAERYLGLSVNEARRRAHEGRLAIPTYQVTDSRKSPWLVNPVKLAAIIDEREAKAAQEWEAKVQALGAAPSSLA